MQKLLRIFFCIAMAMKLATVTAQDPFAAGTSLGKSILGNLKDKKKQKNIQASVTEVQLNGRQVSLLRVPEDKVISPAKNYIVSLQEQLERYRKACDAHRHIDLPAYNDDIAVLKNVDPDWPVSYYVKELEEYRSFEQALVIEERKQADSIAVAKRLEEKRQADALALARRRFEDSVAYAGRTSGYHFINREYVAVREKPGEKSPSLGRLYLGSYVKVAGYSETSGWVKISFDGREGFVDRTVLVDAIDKISTAGADLSRYRNQYYNRFEPNFDYTPAQNVSYEAPAVEQGAVRAGRPVKQAVRKQQRSYITGPRGGCYYLSASGSKVYVDRSLCSY